MADAAQLSDAKRALLERYLRGKTPQTGASPTLIPRRTLGSAVSLSFGQERLQRLAQLAPDLPLNHECVTVTITGPLTVRMLEQSFTEVIRRHEIMRTTFSVRDGQAVQITHAGGPFMLPLVDVRGLAAEERDAEALRIATAVAQRPFDLCRGPFLRATLVRLDDTRHKLFLVLHYIVSDCYAIYGVFIRELAALYEAFSTGDPSPLPELPVQYADYAAWQRDDTPQRLPAAVSYWREHLAGALPVLDLPTDRPRPPAQTFVGALQWFRLHPALVENLYSLCRQEGVTLFMALTAAFATLLHSYTGDEDILMASLTAGRNRSEFEGLMGFFNNTIALRAGLSGNPTFRELLARVRQVILNACCNDDVPFELLAKELQPERDIARDPLFRVTIGMEPPLPTLPPEWVLSPEDIDTGTSKADLSLEFCDRPDEFVIRLQYNTDLFDASTIARMKERFLMLLEGIVADPGQHVAGLRSVMGTT